MSGDCHCRRPVAQNGKPPLPNVPRLFSHRACPKAAPVVLQADGTGAQGASAPAPRGTALLTVRAHQGLLQIGSSRTCTTRVPSHAVPETVREQVAGHCKMTCKTVLLQGLPCRNLQAQAQHWLCSQERVSAFSGRQTSPCCTLSRWGSQCIQHRSPHQLGSWEDSMLAAPPSLTQPAACLVPDAAAALREEASCMTMGRARSSAGVMPSAPPLSRVYPSRPGRARMRCLLHHEWLAVRPCMQQEHATAASVEPARRSTASLRQHSNMARPGLGTPLWLSAGPRSLSWVKAHAHCKGLNALQVKGPVPCSAKAVQPSIKRHVLQHACLITLGLPNRTQL